MKQALVITVQAERMISSRTYRSRDSSNSFLDHYFAGAGCMCKAGSIERCLQGQHAGGVIGADSYKAGIGIKNICAILRPKIGRASTGQFYPSCTIMKPKAAGSIIKCQ